MNKVIFKSTYKIDKTTKINHYVLLKYTYLIVYIQNVC